MYKCLDNIKYLESLKLQDSLISGLFKKRYRIQETLNCSTDADSRTDTMLEKDLRKRVFRNVTDKQTYIQTDIATL